MSPEKQRVTIHEAIGVKLFVIHKPIHDPFGYYRENAHGYTSNLSEAWKVPWEVAQKHIGGRSSDPDRVIAEPAPIPDYLNDLNAMHEAEKIAVENYTIRPWKYADVLMQVLHSEDRDYYCNAAQYAILHATAAQRAEAFLRTIGKWEES